MATEAVVLPRCLSHNDTNSTDATSQIGDMGGLKRGSGERDNMLRSSSSSVVRGGGTSQRRSKVNSQFRRCSSISLSTGIADATSVAAAMEQYRKQVGDSVLVKSSLAPSRGQKALTFPPEQKETSVTSLKSQTMGCIVPCQWSRVRKGIKRRKVIYLMKRRFNKRCKQKIVTLANCSEGKLFSSAEVSREENDHSCDFGFDSAHQSKDEILLNSSFSQKYQPKLFQDIAGHEITVKAISNAVKKKKVARLYLFHGPSGTGKTSTARIFAMALNCESTGGTKPCWSCRGCSKSLYIMELCSGSRTAGFERIKTLIQSTSFTQAISGFKVLIIEECHTFTAKAWDELLGILEGGYGSTVIFVLITTDTSMVPKNISSRCQKFSFPKLKDKDITLKLSNIVANEDIRIEREAMQLIITKAEGSLREAENILDQLALLGSTITSSMVQQLVGLVPHNKLIDLLATAISGDTVRTIRLTRELIAAGVEPHALVSQLASLTTDILSGTALADSTSSAGSSKNNRLRRSQLTNTQSERLCSALKILVETEKQLRSSTDQTSEIFASLLEIAAEDVCNRISTGIVFPRKTTLPSGEMPNANSEDIHGQILSHSRSSTDHPSVYRISEQADIDRIEPRTTRKSIDKTPKCRGTGIEKEPIWDHTRDIEEIWQNILERMQSSSVKEFLYHQVKLASLTISSANAIVHLMFKRPEDKRAAQMSEETISKALQVAIGRPVIANMSLEPAGWEIIEENRVSTISQLVDCSHSKQEHRTPSLPEFVNHRNSEAETQFYTAHESSPPSEHLRRIKLKDCEPSQGHDGCPPEEREATTAWPQAIVPCTGLLTQKNQFDSYADPERDILTREQTSIATAQIMTANKPKHRWWSLSSIPHSDASVEPYSQDILFENENESRAKFQKGFSKATEDHRLQNIAVNTGLNSSFRCSDILCPRKIKVRNKAA